MGTPREPITRPSRTRRACRVVPAPLLVRIALVLLSTCPSGGSPASGEAVKQGGEAPAAPASFVELLKQGWQEGSASHALHHRSELDGWRTSLHENHLHHALSESNTADAAEHAVLPGDAHEAQPAQVETLHAHRQVEALLAAAHALGKPAPKQQPVTLADTAPAAAPLVPRSEKSLVLVGNGRSVLKHKLGDRIDGFDIVGRFNYFELGGFTKNVGSRTDLWFLNEMKIPGPRRIRTKVSSFTSKRQMNLKIQPSMKYVVPVSYSYSKGCGAKQPDNCRIAPKEQKRVGKIHAELKAGYAKFNIKDKLEMMKPDYQWLLATKYGYSAPFPSTGLLAVVYCLENYGAPVTITGFDFQEKSLGHYFEKVKKTWTSHSLKGEMKFISRMTAAGMLVVI